MKLSLALAAAVPALLVLSAPETTELPPVVVEATRILDEARDFPAAVSVYGAADIAGSGATSLADFLERKANLPVRHLNANPLQAHLAIRGYGESGFGRVLVLVNGERLNNPDMEAPNLTRVALESVSRIEVLRGPHTVRYGDSASAGVVNIITLDGAVEDKTVVTASGGSHKGYGGSLRRTGRAAENDGPAVAYTAGAGVQGGDGYRDHSAFQVWNADAAVRLSGSEGLDSLLVSAFFNRGFYEMPGALSEAQYRDTPRVAANGAEADDEADVASYGASLKGELREADGDATEIELSVSSRARDADWRGAYPSRMDYDAWAVAASLRRILEGQVAALDNKFMYGADFSYDGYTAKSKSSYGATEGDYRRFAYAGFAQDEIALTETLSLTAGGRAERFVSRWEKSSSGHWNWNEGAWEAGLNWRPTGDVRLFARGDRYYRAPFCDEMNYVAPGDTLEPETGYSTEAGVDFTPGEETLLSLVAFRTVTDDEIFYNPYADSSYGYWTGYNENSPAETERLGFELSAGWERERVAALSASYAFVDAEFTEGAYDGRTVPLVPRNFLALRGEVWFLGDFAFGAGARFFDGQRFGGDFENAHGKLPGFGVADCSLTYAPKSVEGLRVILSADNVFDRKYCDYAGWSDFSGRYYYPAQGRALTLSARMEF